MQKKNNKVVQIGCQGIGGKNPVYIVAEIGNNHNGDLNLAKQLIDAAYKAGCDAVKFQKRTPEICIPESQKNIMRDTPWGHVSYLEYRNKLEFGSKEYQEINRYCKKIGITWFVSCWDTESVDFIEQFEPSCYKIPSALLTDDKLLKHVRKTSRPVILSTGMSTMSQIKSAVSVVGTKNLILAHATSAYPAAIEELNLKMIETLRKTFSVPIGYSGHEVGLPTTVAAVVLGAAYVERHITLDRSMWATDQAASIEPEGFSRLVKYIRAVEKALGDGRKKVYASEQPVMQKLRRFH